MMTAEQLKASILQMAMQGKLVEQRPEEGTGEDLYKEIQAKKKKLIKEGKRKKEKPLSEITEDEIPFDIVESWKWTKLGEIIEFRMGKTPPRADTRYWGGDIPWVSIADMDDGSVITETKEKISSKALKERFGGQLSPKGTLIMSFKLTVGKVSVLGMDAVHNEAIISILPYVDGNDVMRDYLKMVLPLLSVYGKSKKAIMGFTLNSTSLSNIPIPLPPLAEQKRIVAKIEELMPFVEQYAEASTKLNTLNASFPDQMKKSILQQAVMGKLVPQDPSDEPASVLLKKIAEEKKLLIREGKIKKQKPLPEITEEEIPFDIPESWEWIRLQNLAISIVDCPHSTPKYLDEKTGYFALGTKGIGEEGIIRGFFNIDKNTYLKRIERLEPRGNDIVYSREGSIICRAAILPDNKKICLGQRVMLIRCPECISVEYIQQYLMADCTIAILTKNYKGVGVKHINVADVCNLLVPVPPMNEQKRIVDKIKHIIPVIRKMNISPQISHDSTRIYYNHA